MKENAKRILSLILVALLFVGVDAFIFATLTWRVLPHSSEGRSAKVIDLDRYLPFDEESSIYRLKSELKLEGELPVLDGAEGLYPVFSAFAYALYPESAVAFDGENYTPESRLQMNNTLRAYRAVVDGTSDIILCASPSAEQLKYAAECGVELEFVPIGREAFVFFVSGKNPVDGLSTDQLRDIWAGKHLFWSELGGYHLPINPLERLSGSGSQTALLAFLGDTEVHRSPLSVFGSPIGFSFRFYLEDVVRAGNVKMLAVDGVMPTLDNISNGSYPLVSEFFAIYDKNNPNPNVELLVEWMLTEEGQSIIAGTGFAPIR